VPLVLPPPDSRHHIARDRLEPDVPLPELRALLDTACFQPALQVLALADIKDLEVVAALYDRLDAYTGHAHAAADREFAEFEEVQADRTQGAVGYR